MSTIFKKIFHKISSHIQAIIEYHIIKTIIVYSTISIFLLYLTNTMNNWAPFSYFVAIIIGIMVPLYIRALIRQK